MNIPPPAERSPRRAYSLIEIMVAMSLLTVIVVGLIASLNQAQKALRLSGSQSDTFENGRAFLALMSRELQEVAVFPPEVTNTYRFFSAYRNASEPLIQSVPGLPGEPRTNLLSSFGFVVRGKERNDWRLIMYDVSRDQMNTRSSTAIYRTERSYPSWALTNELPIVEREFINWNLKADGETNQFRKLIDGVVHIGFRLFNNKGERIPDWNGAGKLEGYRVVQQHLPSFDFGVALDYRPATIEVELAILDPDVYKKLKSIDDRDAVLNFLQERSGNVQIFRQRITLPTGP